MTASVIRLSFIILLFQYCYCNLPPKKIVENEEQDYVKKEPVRGTKIFLKTKHIRQSLIEPIGVDTNQWRVGVERKKRQSNGMVLNAANNYNFDERQANRDLPPVPVTPSNSNTATVGNTNTQNRPRNPRPATATVRPNTAAVNIDNNQPTSWQNQGGSALPNQATQGNVWGNTAAGNEQPGWPNQATQGNVWGNTAAGSQQPGWPNQATQGNVWVNTAAGNQQPGWENQATQTGSNLNANPPSQANPWANTGAQQMANPWGNNDRAPEATATYPWLNANTPTAPSSNQYGGGQRADYGQVEQPNYWSQFGPEMYRTDFPVDHYQYHHHYHHHRK